MGVAHEITDERGTRGRGGWVGYSGEDPVGNLRALERGGVAPGVLFNGLPAFGTVV